MCYVRSSLYRICIYLYDYMIYIIRHFKGPSRTHDTECIKKKKHPTLKGLFFEAFSHEFKKLYGRIGLFEEFIDL